MFEKSPATPGYVIIILKILGCDDIIRDAIFVCIVCMLKLASAPKKDTIHLRNKQSIRDDWEMEHPSACSRHIPYFKTNAELVITHKLSLRRQDSQQVNRERQASEQATASKIVIKCRLRKAKQQSVAKPFIASTSSTIVVKLNNNQS